MITLNSGTPGSGKSYDTSRVIYEYLEQGKTVISNYEVYVDKVVPKKNTKVGTFILCENKEINVINLVWYALTHHVNVNGKIAENQALIVIDEAQNLFNARDWKNPNRHLWIEFFTQHRKLGYDIILTSQSADFIDKQIRGCIQVEMKHRRVSNYGFSGILMSIFFGYKCKLFLRIEYDFPTGSKYFKTYLKPNQKIFDFYESNKLFESQFIDYNKLLSMKAPTTGAFAERTPVVGDSCPPLAVETE